MKDRRINVDILHDFICKIMFAHNVNNQQVESVSNILIWSDLIGRNNYGVLRLNVLLKRLRKNLINMNCRPIFKKTSASTELLNGDNGFGQYIAEMGMNRAIDLARNNGVGIIGIYNSNFSGAGGYYVNLAARSNMIGIALSNSFPKVAAYGGNKAVLGTNPFSFGAPNRNGKNIMFDMATSAGAGSMVRECIRKSIPLPEDIALDLNGNPTTDPENVEQGTLLPMGGAKGFGLAFMVEVLCGVITGAGVSHEVKSMYQNFSENGNNGQFLMALDLSKWISMEVYFERIGNLVSILKESAIEQILMPGEKRWKNYTYNLEHGVEIEEKAQFFLTELANRDNIDIPW